MTVCLATLFRWNYAIKGDPDDYSMAAIAVSDRMITAGDVQYEPKQLKVAFITPRVIILIAGDYSIHSQAVRSTIDQFRNKPDALPQDVAATYGRAIQAVKLRQAEDLFLAPLGLNMDTFTAQQKDFSDSFATRLTDQMQGFRGEDVEAIVTGSDGRNAQIYTVDTIGTVNYLDDVGFAAIGTGAWHVKSRLMQAGYSNFIAFAPALAVTFAAKKAAEVAPGVGKETDMHLVLRDAVIPLQPDIAATLEKLHKKYEEERTTLASSIVAELQASVVAPKDAQKHDQGSKIPGADAQINARPPENAAQAPRKDESGKAS